MSITRTYSVVMPAYNAEQTIDASLRSVLAQSLAPLEVIVVDDKSTDGTETMVRRLMPEFQARGIALQFLIQPQNRGPSAARNRGIASARGNWIAFLDSDDTWVREKLHIVDRQLSLTPTAALVCHDYDEDAVAPRALAISDHRPKDLSISDWLLRNWGQSSCVVMGNAIGRRFDERMRCCEDQDLWLRIAERERTLALIGTPLTHLGRPQLTPGGLSGDVVRMRRGEIRTYLNFCLRSWPTRLWMLPGLVGFSATKHVVSVVRRWAR
ncbi:MAG: glycosyltransferase family 2 protein [Alphaproteobacteria bacterium]|nr:MAG: glycosyltransferase family 2 protein [Alphaproteobacteria bacterium]